MKGDFVVVRSLNGPVLARVIEAMARIVYIASQDQYDLRKRGLPALAPVGFRVSDVFQYDPRIEKDIARGKVEWQRLTPYKAKASASEAAA